MTNVLYDARDRQVPIDPRKLHAYAGRYPLTPQFVLTVTAKDGHLMVRATRQNEYEVVPEGDTRFSIARWMRRSPSSWHPTEPPLHWYFTRTAGTDAESAHPDSVMRQRENSASADSSVASMPCLGLASLIRQA
jgi:Domain of unknown function (DUF3471)